MNRFAPIKWSPVEEDFLKKNRESISINQLTIQLAKSRAAIKRKLDEFDGTPIPGKKNKKSFIGKRVDLGNQYFRSKWEANVARVLNHKGIKWLYEPRVFFFGEFKSGTLTYCPDFYLPDQEIWLEVKGQITPKGKTAIRRFKKFFPEEASKLFAITGTDKTAAAKFFVEQKIPFFFLYNEIKKEFEKTLPHWE